MAGDPPSARLAVIMHADIAGSTKLVQHDKELAHERIRETFGRLGAAIEENRGHVLELRGDALLSWFDRATDAVTAALSFQAAEDREPPGDDFRPAVRIGIAMGEVVIADHTVTGAGVVQAQRIEQLAEPGGVCITSAIHEALSKRMPLDIDNLGEHILKGFDHPLRVYRVTLRPGESILAPARRGRRTARPGTRKTALGIVALALLAAGATAVWIQLQTPGREPASLERMAFPIPDKPSIAVLPFTNLSDVREQDYFADGMTDDLITDISKISGLFVIARNSVFTYKGRPVEIRQVAEELGVRYVLEGSVQRVGSKIRINAQLIDATTAGHVWAERYDGTLDDVFAMRDKITRNIVAALSATLLAQVESSSDGAETTSTEAYESFLRGWTHYRLSTPEDSVKAISYFDKAIGIDPDFGRAHAALAATYWRIYENNWAKSTGIAYSDALDITNRHLEAALENPTPLAHRTAAKKFFYLRRWDDAMREAQLAIELDPNDPSGYEAMGTLLINLGRPAEGLDYIRKAMRFDPQSDYLYHLGEAQFHLEHYAEAETTLRRAIELNPLDEWNYFLLAATYGHLGRVAEARDAIARFNEAYHDPTDRQRKITLAELDTWNFMAADIRQRLREGLRRAGVPAGESASPADTEYQALVTLSTDGFQVDGAIRIDASEAKSRFDRDAVFIDSRGSGEFQRGHVPGAANLLFHEIWNGLPPIAARDREVVFYCGDEQCHLAANSSAQALILGYTRVYYFAGGFSAWKQAGYPVEGL